MMKKKFQIEINGCVETDLNHDEWWDQFIDWIESRGEYFCGISKDASNKNTLKPFAFSKNKSMFTEEIQKVIRIEVERGRYDPATDPFLINHKKKINKILKRQYFDF